MSQVILHKQLLLQVVAVEKFLTPLSRMSTQQLVDRDRMYGDTFPAGSFIFSQPTDGMTTQQMVIEIKRWKNFLLENWYS